MTPKEKYKSLTNKEFDAVVLSAQIQRSKIQKYEISYCG